MKKLLFISFFMIISIAYCTPEDFVIIRMVRHGQPGVKGTSFTPEQKKSWIGLGLTPLGIEQARLTGEYLKKENRKYIVIASPQERAAETADIICSILGTTFTLDKDLREVGNAIRETLPLLRKRFKNIAPAENMSLTAEEAKNFKESSKAMGIRGKNLVMKLVNSGQKGPFLLVGHGGFINATILALTGKRFPPWNCGMCEIKVWKNAKAQLVKAGYPEIFHADLITDNQITLENSPWHGKFLIHKAERSKDVKFLEREFEKLKKGKYSTWRRGRGSKVRLSLKNNAVTLIASKDSAFSITSPRFPVRLTGKYTIKLKAYGKGTCSIWASGGGSRCKRVFPLSPEEKEYIFEAGPHKNRPFHMIQLKAEKGSSFSITSFKLIPSK